MARNSTLASGRMPNHTWNASRAWWISMPSPSTVGLPRARCRQQRRFKRRVDDVGHDGRDRQPVERQIERRLARHALARRVDEQTDIGEPRVPVFPRKSDDAAAKIARQIVRPRRTAIDDADLPAAAFEQTVDDRARTPASAREQRRPAVGAPVRAVGQHALHEASRVGVGT